MIYYDPWRYISAISATHCEKLVTNLRGCEDTQHGEDEYGYEGRDGYRQHLCTPVHRHQEHNIQTLIRLKTIKEMKISKE